MRRNSLPSFTAVIEWENVRLSEFDRARKMLAQLAIQIEALQSELSEPPELIVLYDQHAIDPSEIEESVREAFQRLPGIGLRLIPMEEKATYYLQKNRGAEAANRDLVMFVDSDVIPEPGWLASLIGSFRDPNVEVVCGNTYVEPKDRFSKAFAAFWFFPLRSRRGGLTPATYFYANNVLFRRDVFLAYQFPDLPQIRGQCVELGQALVRDGRRLFMQNDARVAHPPPNGFKHFVKRALCQGHDNMVISQRVGDSRGFPMGSARRYAGAVVRSLRQINRNRSEVGMGRLDVLAAVGIAFTYHSLSFVGEGITWARPAYIREHLAV